MLLNDVFLNSILDVYTSSIVQRIDFYSGPIPATGDTDPTGTLLAGAGQWFPGVDDHLYLPGCFRFETLQPGVASIYAVSSEANTGDRVAGNVQSPPAYATGTIGYAMLHFGGSPDLIIYCSVGTANAELIVDSLNIVAGDSVGIVSMKFTVPSSV
jgi:hypothetical protein